jgi:hypothetical protein
MDSISATVLDPNLVTFGHVLEINRLINRFHYSA